MLEGQKAVNGISGGSSLGGFHTGGSDAEESLVLLVKPDMTGGGGKGLVRLEELDVVLVLLDTVPAGGMGGGGGKLVN